MARLILVDTADELPGLLPLHGWSALMSSELVLVGDDDHPFVDHLHAAELRHETVPDLADEGPVSRQDLLSGLSPAQKRQAEWIVDRARSEGEVAYLYGPGDREAFTRTLGMEAARAGVEVEVVYFAVAPKGTPLLGLVAVQERLRGPGGCPWDAEQSHDSLMRYAVEEVYELAEAVAEGDDEAIREELGDLLLQVVFHAQIAEERRRDAPVGAPVGFDIDDVARGITDKLVRRHPHVFGDTTVADAGEVMANWETFKAAEKPERSGVFDGVPPAQPALGYAAKLLARAAGSRVDPDAGGDPTGRVREELDAFAAATDDSERAAGLGDLLLSVVAAARRSGIDPEQALRAAAARFRDRVEDAADGGGPS